MTSRLSKAEEEELLKAAYAAAQNAYAPFSEFYVGSALLTTSGEIFTGCNVENSSYGLTNCAERTAIFSAVAKLGGANVEIKAIAAVNRDGLPCAPCGACRQVIFEFGAEAIVVYNSGGGVSQSHIRELLPEGFRLDR
jgi:cytidine deaminase